MSTIDSVLQAAKSWVGRMFNPGVPAQCAVFVRAVFQEAGVTLPVTQHPDDGLPTSAALADSFAGDDVGARVAQGDLQPGDIVMFDNTYGNYPAGTITHVGVYVGDGQMVDRPTSSEPVSQRGISLFTFAEGRRPNLGAAPTTPAPTGAPTTTTDTPTHTLKAFAHDGKLSVVLDGQELPARSIQLIVGW